jgi:peptidoglycan/LPS O-acetylase OafA/YrhL
MNTKAASFAYAVAIAGGAILWLATVVMSGRTEAWDSPSYWTVTYPLAILLAGYLGYKSPEKPWRWGLTVMFVQAVVLAISSSSYGLLPLGLILFGVLALPAIGLAQITARLRLRNENA